jgi:hypothetical protein
MPGLISERTTSVPSRILDSLGSVSLNLEVGRDDPIVVEPVHVACSVEHSKARVRPCQECEMVDPCVDAQLPPRV